MATNDYGDYIDDQHTDNKSENYLLMEKKSESGNMILIMKVNMKAYRQK